MNALEYDNNNGLSETKHDGSVAVTIDILTLSLLISAVLYSFCLILAKRKFFVLHRLSPELSTKKLLILSVALVAVVRIMTILGVVSLNIANVRAHYSLQPPHSGGHSSAGDRHQLFYDKSVTVLFDLPNCMVVSTYVLLTLVWAECFLDSRLHTEPARQWKKTWIIYFMVFNTALYAVQLALYGGIFLAPPSRTVRTLIYIGITGINFTAVVLVLTFYVYLNFRFSGFPYRSQRSRISLSRVASVMSLWTVTRVVWGVATLLVFIHNIELLQDSNTPVWSFVVLLLLFVVCEILPIIALLDYSYLNMVGLEQVEVRWVEDDNSQPILMDPLLPSDRVPPPPRVVRWEDQVNDSPL